MAIPLAQELASVGNRVNCIAPGLTDTPMMACLSEPAKVFLPETTAFPKRSGSPDECAALASPRGAEDAFLNGSVARLDEALRMVPEWRVPPIAAVRNAVHTPSETLYEWSLQSLACCRLSQLPQLS